MIISSPMPYLRNSILATIVYYDAFDFPLTLLEVYKYMVNPGRLAKVPSGIKKIELSHVFNELELSLKAKLIGQKNGFYFLPGRESLYDTRIAREKINAQKWKKLLRYCRWLTMAPFLKGILASGSIALGNTTDKSDFDVLIISKSKRLYTCRLFLWMISSILGIRRKRFESKAPDKLCFNHYITEDRLLLPESLFNAQTYANLKPVWIDLADLEKLYRSNIWINNYLYNFRPQTEFVRRSIKAPGLFRLISWTGETALNSFAGDWLENLLKSYQQTRIKKNPMTYESGGRIVFTDKALEFHPRSFERTVLAKYKTNLKKFGIIPYFEEKDSGLTA